MILSQFQAVGRDLFARGIVSSNGGNLSIRMGDNIIITRRGSMLNALQEHDLIETGLVKNNRSTPLASVSMIETEIVPNTTDSLATLGKVPVVGWNMEVKAGGLADIIAQTLKEHRVIMVHSHGSFAIGQLLEEAYNFTTMLEESCRVLCLLKSLQVSSAQQ